MASNRLQPLMGATATLSTWMAENIARLHPADIVVLLAVGGAVYAAETEHNWKKGSIAAEPADAAVESYSRDLGLYVQ